MSKKVKNKIKTWSVYLPILVVVLLVSLILFLYSKQELKLTTFTVLNAETNELGEFLVSEGQEVEIMIRCDWKWRLEIKSFELNGYKMIPGGKVDNNQSVYYDIDNNGLFIIVKYKVSLDIDTLVLENVTVKGNKFFTLGNSFNYNNKEVIKLKLI